MNRQQKIRLLVKNILSQNTQKADKMLQKIIAQAEDEREDEAKAEAEEELGVPADEDEAPAEDAPEADDEDFNQDELDQDEFTEFDIDDDGEEAAPEGDDEFGPVSDEEQLADDTELNDLATKQVNFEVEINNLVLNDLQNKVAGLKTALENNTTLDKHSREYYEIQVPLQYYAEHLSEMKKNVSPLVNQDDIKKQLDEIQISLQELSNKIGGGEDEISTLTPNEVIDKDLKPEF